jgi:hypothetical protein
MTHPYSPKFPVQIRHFAWDKSSFPVEEDGLGEKLFSLVVEKSFVGRLPLELWLFTESAIQTVSFKNPVNYHQISSLCGMDGVVCAALMGSFVSQNQEVKAQVFIEWNDCRWWYGRQPLRKDGSVVFQFPKISKATSLDSKPIQLGGWFSTARRMGLHAKLESEGTNWIH